MGRRTSPTRHITEAPRSWTAPRPQGVAALRIDIAGDRRYEARDVAGAAGDAEPGLALMLALRFERIRIEEALAVERNAGDEAIVERALHHVDVARIGMEEEQAMI